MEHVFELSDESLSHSNSLSGSAFSLQTAAVYREENLRRSGQMWNECVQVCVYESSEGSLLRGVTRATTSNTTAP